MRTIGLTEFWTERPYLGRCNDFTILSDKYVNLNSVITGENKMLVYNGHVDKYQIKVFVDNNIFYVDFSATGIREQIDQQIWILKHTKKVEYTISFVSLWELFQLPTIEQLNEFAKVKEEIVPQILIRPTEEEYLHAIEEMRLSTGLSEDDQIRNIGLSLTEYLDLMSRMSHTRLSNEDAVRYVTIVHNYHNPVVQEELSIDEDTYLSSLNFLVEETNTDEELIYPEPGEDLSTYISAMITLFEEEGNIEVSEEQITHNATIVWIWRTRTR